MRPGGVPLSRGRQLWPSFRSAPAFSLALAGCDAVAVARHELLPHEGHEAPGVSGREVLAEALLHRLQVRWLVRHTSCGLAGNARPWTVSLGRGPTPNEAGKAGTLRRSMPGRQTCGLTAVGC